MAKRILKCNHADTEDTVILDRYRKVDKDVVIRSAVLIVNCNDCQKEIFNAFVGGGILFSKKE